jgi:sugar lactone lactonase YvrE
VWAGLNDGAPDGISIDADNAVWYGDVPNKRCMRVREGGEVLQTMFMMAAEWHGLAKMADGLGTGQVLFADAPAPGAGWP